VYVVVAYRWGTLNNHTYNVTATADRAEAIASAKDECDGRGGKYGVGVMEYPAEKRIAYFPSIGDSADATGPEHSDELAAAHYIGGAMLTAFQRGVRWAPSGPAAALTEVPAEIPSWIADLCQHSLSIHRSK